jgi:DNA polymerase I-like protein with 3'-5' exonuclease and polymerase domains
MLKIKEAGWRIALTVHDAAVCVVPEDKVDEAMKSITGIMSTPPDWAKGLPVACEAHFATSYGDC